MGVARPLARPLPTRVDMARMAQNPHILLVDENTSVREALQRALRSENFQVVSAASGSEALRKFEENQIDAALVDLNLDRHESGWDVFQALTHLAPLLPIIVMVGASFADDP